MSLILPEGLFLDWQEDDPYVDREHCQQRQHDRCGTHWANVPGVPHTVVEMWPEEPHSRRSLWSYQFLRKGQVVQEDRDAAKDQFSLRRWLVVQATRFLAPFPWVVVNVAVSADGTNWRARLMSGSQPHKDLLAPCASSSKDEGLLGALEAFLGALKRPCKVAVNEASGRILEIFQVEGVDPVRTARLEAIEQRSRRHFLKLLPVKKKAQLV